MSKKKVGRPPVEDPRDKQYRLRMTDSEYRELVDLGKSCHMSMSDIVRRGIELVRDNFYGMDDGK